MRAQSIGARCTSVGCVARVECSFTDTRGGVSQGCESLWTESCVDGRLNDSRRTTTSEMNRTRSPTLTSIMPCWTRDCCRVCGWRVGLQSSGYYHAMAVVDTVRAAGDGSILIKCTLCQPPDTEWTHWTTLSVRCPDIRPRKPAPVHLPPGQQSPGHLPRGQDPLDISPWTCVIRSPDVRPLLTKAPQKG